jgi:two-component system cell cycle response regulator CtrA
LSNLALRDAYVASLEAENDVLRARISMLEQEIGIRNEVPLVFGLTGQESRILSMLMQRGMTTKEQLLVAVTTDPTGNQQPTIKIVDVFICKMRKKLAPFGIVIETVWGRGYNLDQENRRKVNGYLNANSRRAMESGDGAVHEPAAGDGRVYVAGGR